VPNHPHQLSHVVGASQPPLLELTIGQALDLAVDRWPHQEALVSCEQGVRLTWTELREAADAVACGLLALGIATGDRVGIWAPNCAEWTIVQFATARAGMILVNVNPAYRTTELEFTLKKVGVKALVSAAAFRTSNQVEMVETLLSAGAEGDILEDPRFPALHRLIKIGGKPRKGWVDFPDLGHIGTMAERRRLDALENELSGADAINIQFTSGTTGLPKGATLSHRNILNNAFFVGWGMGLKQGDRLCVPVPLYHCFGMVMSNLTCLLHGATMVYPSAAFDPEAVLRTVGAERCTALHGVPTMFIAELGHPDFDRFDLSTLRTGIMAGSPCPVEVMRSVIDRMNMRDVGIAYGMTETSPVSFQTSVDDPLERRVSTIGRVQPHLEVKIVDPNTGKIVPRGQAGELCTRGYSVMLGYWGDSEKTAEAVRGGWMHTGDLAVIDDQGYGRIVGRIKDMIIRGGENIYPREIEEFLYENPSVEDVQVVGVPDPRYGEVVCACVKLRAGQSASEEELVAFCRGKIAHYKVPHYVRFVDAFPMTVTGKIQKHVLRQNSAEVLGLS
jgi:fatty-acyl-CoA synthase